VIRLDDARCVHIGRRSGGRRPGSSGGFERADDNKKNQ